MSGCYLIDLEEDDPQWESVGSLAENRGLARAAPVEGGARWIITGGQDEVRVFSLFLYWLLVSRVYIKNTLVLAKLLLKTFLCQHIVLLLLLLLLVVVVMLLLHVAYLALLQLVEMPLSLK